MLVRSATYAAVVTLLSVPALAGDDKDRLAREQRKIRDLQKRAYRLGNSGNGPSDAFLAARSMELFTRLKKEPATSWVSGRLIEALDDVLDAREDLRRAAPGSDDEDDEDKDDNRDRTARKLERAYFRVQQAGYFGELSRDAHSSAYVRHARRLYQAARSAYDRQEYAKAQRTASAAEEIVNALENLAQATVRLPEPPRLP